MSPHRMFIDGEARDASNGATMEVLSPATGKVISHIPNATKGDVDAAVASAQRCQKSEWSKPNNVAVRCAVLKKIAKHLRENTQDLAYTESKDCGKTLEESKGDIGYCADLCDYYADIGPKFMESQDIDGVDKEYTAKTVKFPVGVVGCITPWNYPLMQAVAKVAPGIAAGCALVLKPSPWASLTCLELGQICYDCGCPKGALNVISGGGGGAGSVESGDAGSHLGAHPGLAKMSFTGSCRTGRLLLEAGAAHLRPATIELGGKGCLVVFADSDLEAAVDWAMIGIFSVTGQVCSATSRVLVEESVKDQFVERLVEETKKIKVGDPLAPSTQMGPLAFAAQHEKVHAALAAAKAEGCKVEIGGGVPKADDLQPGEHFMTHTDYYFCELANGYWVEPTILTDVPENSSAWTEEIFGPVLSIRTFTTEEEAIEQVNASKYGLGHGVMTRYPEKAARVANALEAGVVWVNCNNMLWPSTPFGGWKMSGFGKEMGTSGMAEYTQDKTIIGAENGFMCNGFIPA